MGNIRNRKLARLTCKLLIDIADVHGLAYAHNLGRIDWGILSEKHLQGLQSSCSNRDFNHYIRADLSILSTLCDNYIRIMFVDGIALDTNVTLLPMASLIYGHKDVRDFCHKLTLQTAYDFIIIVRFLKYFF